jgi:hypothetical protein
MTRNQVGFLAIRVEKTEYNVADPLILMHMLMCDIVLTF